VFSQSDQLALVPPQDQALESIESVEPSQDTSSNEELDILSTLENTNEPSDQELSESALAGGLTTVGESAVALSWSIAGQETSIVIDEVSDLHEPLVVEETKDFTGFQNLKITDGQVEMPLASRIEDVSATFSSVASIPSPAVSDPLPPMLPSYDGISNAGASWGLAKSIIGAGNIATVEQLGRSSLGMASPPRARATENRAPQEQIERWTQTTLGVSELLPPATGVMSRFGGVIAIGAPIIGFLMLLGLLTIGITSTSNSDSGFASSISNFINPGAARVASNDLRVQNLQFKRIALDNGEVVPVISGRLDNGSNERYRQVLLEGLLFDRNGTVVSANRVNAASTLSRARIKSLSTDVINSFQSGQVVKRFDLKPGAAQDFSVVLIGPPAANTKVANTKVAPRFYSVRIHSVR